MKKYIIFFLLASICFASVTECVAANKFSFLESIFKYSTDVAKLGKKSEVTLNAVEKGALIKKYPRLAKSGDDILKGIISIEKTMAKSPAAERMIERGINPARVAVVTNRYPATIKTGENIANFFSASKIKLDAPDIKKLPSPAVNALKKMDGNYNETANAFLSMTRRGGQKAVVVAERLLEYVNLKNAASVTALGLLAWHMQDPAGCEEAVENFFKEHVAPVATAPAKGLIKAATESMDETIDTASQNIGKIVVSHWYLLIFILIVLFLWKIPNARRLLFNLLNNMFGKINNKFESQPNNISSACRNKANSSGNDSGLSGNRVNVYRR